MGPQTFCHFLFLSLLILLTTTSTSLTTSTTIYDYLHHHGLPKGLLPKGITDFSSTTTPANDTLFQISLPYPCIAKFENQLHYDLNISFYLAQARLFNISGVSAQDLFLWFPVKGIHVDVPSSGVIYFDVGVVDKQFSLSIFESPPDCTMADPLDPNGLGNGGFSNLEYQKGRSGKLKYKLRQPDVLRAVS